MSESLDDRIREELTAYLDGELDEQAVADLEERLRRDPSLRRELEEYKRAWELLDFLPQPEPSPDFTTRTLDRLAVMRPPQSATATLPPLGPLPAPESVSRRWTRGVLSAVAVALLGYFLTGLALPPTPTHLSPVEREERLAADLRLLDRLHLYRYGEDIEFLRALDHPDLFGD